MPKEILDKHLTEESLSDQIIHQRIITYLVAVGIGSFVWNVLLFCFGISDYDLGLNSIRPRQEESGEFRLVWSFFLFFTYPVLVFEFVLQGLFSSFCGSNGLSISRRNLYKLKQSDSILKHVMFIVIGAFVAFALFLVLMIIGSIVCLLVFNRELTTQLKHALQGQELVVIGGIYFLTVFLILWRELSSLYKGLNRVLIKKEETRST